MTALPCKTPVAAKLLGVTLSALRAAIDSGKLHRPEHRDTSGHLLWDEGDLERARAAMSIDLRRRHAPEPVPAA